MHWSAPKEVERARENQAMVSTNLYKAETLSTLQRYVLQQCSRTLIVAP